MAKTVMSGILLSLYSSVVLKLYLDTFLSRAGKVRSAAGWMLFFIWQFLSELGYFSPGIVLFLTSVTIVFTGLAAYEGNIWKRCMFPTVYLAVWMLLEGLADFGSRYLSGEGETAFLMISVPSKVMLLLVVLGVKGYAKTKRIGKEPCSMKPVFLAVPVMGMLLYDMLFRLLQGLHANQLETDVWMMIFACFLIFLNLSFYPLYVQHVSSIHIRKDTETYMKQIELFRKEKEMEETAAAQIRELRHNMRSHLACLGELLQAKEYEKAGEMIEELTEETHSHGTRGVMTGNMVMDCLINHAEGSAQKAGIGFHRNIVVPLPGLRITDSDMCVIVGNALDNALEASAYVEEGRREIWVAVNYAKGVLLFEIKNHYEGQISWDEEGNISSRKGGNDHGYGMCSIRKTAEKYQGMVEVSTVDGEFLLQILLYV